MNQSLKGILISNLYMWSHVSLKDVVQVGSPSLVDLIKWLSTNY